MACGRPSGGERSGTPHAATVTTPMTTASPLRCRRGRIDCDHTSAIPSVLWRSFASSRRGSAEWWVVITPRMVNSQGPCQFRSPSVSAIWFPPVNPSIPGIPSCTPPYHARRRMSIFTSIPTSRTNGNASPGTTSSSSITAARPNATSMSTEGLPGTDPVSETPRLCPVRRPPLLTMHGEPDRLCRA